jgi:hypothetical protein
MWEVYSSIKMIYLFYRILVLVYVNYISTYIYYLLIHSRYKLYAYRNTISKSFIRSRIIRIKKNIYNRANKEKGKHI